MFDNKSLFRQLKRGLGVDGPQGLEALLKEIESVAADHPKLGALAQKLPVFLSNVAESYRQFDRDITLRNRSLELSSLELTQVNDRLRREGESQQQVLNALRATTNELLKSSGLTGTMQVGEDLLELVQLIHQLLAQRQQAQTELAESELKFRSLISNLPGCVYRCLADERYSMVFLSEGIADLTGYPAVDFIEGRCNLVDLVVPEDKPALFAALNDAISAKQSFQLEYRIRRADGTVCWALGKGQGVFSNDGELLYLDGLILDNTDVKLAQQEILRTRAQLFNAIEALDVGFIMFDETDRLIICNQKYRSLYAHLVPWLVSGTTYEDLLHAHFKTHPPANADEVTEDQWVAHRLSQWRDGSGDTELQMGELWLRQDNSRTPDGITVCLRTDVTAHKMLLRQLTEAKDSAESANRSKSDFLANMSHEIRTPMNGIIGMTEMALGTALSDEQREYLQLVKSSADSLLVIVNDILDFSKMEAGKLTIDSIPFSLRSTLGECLKPLAFRAHDKGVELMYRVDPGVGDSLVGDPGRIRQLVINLVGNAIKFTEQGEVCVEVSAKTTDAGKLELMFSVRDSGIGIPKEKQRLIFEAFSQADASTTRRYGGTGLGLAICTRLAQLMGGRLWVESEFGHGSTFHFTLSVGISEVEPQRLSLAPDFAGRKVLIADGNVTSRTWLAEVMHHWGLEVTQVSDGRQALVAIMEADSPFAAVLMDSHLKGLSGFAVAQAMRERPDVLSRMVLMIMSINQRGDAARCKALGLAGHIVKPVSASDLQGMFMRLLGLAPAEVEDGRQALTAPIMAQHKLRILLAEDHPVNQKLAVLLLNRLGHEVVVAQNGQEAVEMSLAEPFDLILMDMQMPVMGGIEATQAIRQREAAHAHHRMPIIAMTANAMQGDMERCLAAGMDGYVSKPINPQVMVKEMDRVLIGEI